MKPDKQITEALNDSIEFINDFKYIEQQICIRNIINVVRLQQIELTYLRSEIDVLKLEMKNLKQ